MTALENVNPGAIIFCPSKNPLGDVVDAAEIATVTRDIDYRSRVWLGQGDYMEDGWFRYENIINCNSCTILIFSNQVSPLIMS
jgi:hypothetical protein